MSRWFPTLNQASTVKDLSGKLCVKASSLASTFIVELPRNPEKLAIFNSFFLSFSIYPVSVSTFTVNNELWHMVENWLQS